MKRILIFVLFFQSISSSGNAVEVTREDVIISSCMASMIGLPYLILGLHLETLRSSAKPARVLEVAVNALPKSAKAKVFARASELSQKVFRINVLAPAFLTALLLTCAVSPVVAQEVVENPAAALQQSNFAKLSEAVGTDNALQVYRQIAAGKHPNVAMNDLIAREEAAANVEHLEAQKARALEAAEIAE